MSNEPLTEQESRARVARICPDATHVGVHADRVVIHVTGGVSLWRLRALSEAFSTETVDVDCDFGTDDDPGHSTAITVWPYPVPR